MNTWTARDADIPSSSVTKYLIKSKQLISMSLVTAQSCRRVIKKTETLYAPIPVSDPSDEA